MYSYLLAPKELRDEILKTKNNGTIYNYTGLGLALIKLLVSAPLAISTEALESERGQEMIHYYQEAENKGSEEAHEILNSYSYFFKQFKNK